MDVASRFREYVTLDRKRTEGGLSPSELHRWRVLKKFLTEHFTPGEKVEKDTRRSVRVPTRVNVSFSSEGDFARCLMTNISRHGVFIRTDHPMELKSRFELKIHIDDPPRDIVVPVEVLSVGVGPGFSADRQGMGVRFLDTDEETTRLLEALYEQALG